MDRRSERGAGASDRGPGHRRADHPKPRPAADLRGVPPLQHGRVRHLGRRAPVRLRADRARVRRASWPSSSSSRPRSPRHPPPPSATGSRAIASCSAATSSRPIATGLTALAMIVGGAGRGRLPGRRLRGRLGRRRATDPERDAPVALADPRGADRGERRGRGGGGDRRPARPAARGPRPDRRDAGPRVRAWPPSASRSPPSS